ncbi:MAG: GAF domain-containing protein [Geitlerinemataceae cyanobacterium]
MPDSLQLPDRSGPKVPASLPDPASLDLEQRLVVAELLNEINLLVSRPLELDEVLDVTCRSLGRVLRCSRISILVRNSNGEAAMATRGEYLGGNYPSQLGIEVPVAGNAHLQQTLDRPETVLAVEDFPNFPGLNEEARAVVESLSIQSMLTTATVYRDRVNGVIGIHQCDRRRRWALWEEQLIDGVSRQLGIAIGQAQLYESTRDAAMQESLMRRVTDRIRSTSDINAICQTAVNGARTLLQTDRVAIYQFKKDWRGRVIVESVAEPWSSVLGDIGADDCFSGKYAELYRNGRIRAIDDIETDPKLDACHVNFLRSLQVRSNLIVPISLKDGNLLNASQERLWGLAIAHQCGRPRRWRSREIQLMSQLAGQIAIAINQVELDHRIQSQARRERMLRHTVSQIRSSFDLMAILQTAATSVRELLGSDRVTVYRFRKDFDGDVVVESVSDRAFSILNRNVRDNCFTNPRKSYFAGQIRAIEDIATTPELDECHRQFLMDLDVKSYAIAPIVIRPESSLPDSPYPHSAIGGSQMKLWGLTIVHECETIRDWQRDDLSLLRQVNDQIAIAIQQSELYERARERARQEQALRQSVAQIRSSLDLTTSLQAAADSARSVLATDRVTIYQFDDSWDGRVVVESVARPQWSVLNRDVSDDCFQGESAQLYREGRVRTIFDIHTDPGLDECHRDFLAALPTRSSATVGLVVNVDRNGEPVRDGGRAWLWGLLIVHQCETSRDWTSEETSILRQLGDQMAIAIQQSTLYERTRSQAETLQDTLDRLQSTQEKLLRSEKLSSLGKMAGGVAHEINNANNFVFANLHHARAYIQDVLGALEDASGAEVEAIREEIDFEFVRDDFPKLMTSIESGSTRIKDIVEVLQQFSSTQTPEFQLVLLRDRIERCLTNRRQQLAGIRVVTNFDVPCGVECHPPQLERALGNVLDNAIEAVAGCCADTAPDAQPDPCITIDIIDRGQWVELSITDSGAGIPDEIRARIFDPFFTTKDVGDGTGLGLTVTYQIVVEGHGGKIDVLTPPSGGTTFAILLPVNQVTNQ